PREHLKLLHRPRGPTHTSHRIQGPLSKAAQGPMPCETVLGREVSSMLRWARAPRRNDGHRPCDVVPGTGTLVLRRARRTALRRAGGEDVRHRPEPGPAGTQAAKPGARGT